MSRNAYEDFVQSIIHRRNRDRKERLGLELRVLAELPRRDWNAPQELFVSVRPWSTVSILRSVYSVPSRLVGAKLRALVYSDRVELYFGKNLVQEMPKVRPGESAINYRHVIAHLVRKPGAFRNYLYRDELFPSTVYRRAFDRLQSAGTDDREYLRILNMAAMDGENLVETALQLLLEMQLLPTEEAVKGLLEAKHPVPEISIDIPNLSFYDELLTKQTMGVAQ